MRRYLILAIVAAMLPVGTLRAQEYVGGFYPNPFGVPPNAPPRQPPQPESWWQRFKRDYHRNNCWPEPWIASDRAAVSYPFQIQADNAWQRQNLLCSYHFVEGTSELNNAGQYHLRWIVTKAPVQRRAVFVERMMNDKATADRVAAVQNMIVRMNPHGPFPPVYESNLSRE